REAKEASGGSLTLSCDCSVLGGNGRPLEECGGFPLPVVPLRRILTILSLRRVARPNTLSKVYVHHRTTYNCKMKQPSYCRGM
ncbi:MAG TPA: hypothetical protein VIS99_17020, partial [Terrimicrobiaceae bacterium]